MLFAKKLAIELLSNGERYCLDESTLSQLTELLLACCPQTLWTTISRNVHRENNDATSLLSHDMGRNICDWQHGCYSFHKE